MVRGDNIYSHGGGPGRNMPPQPNDKEDFSMAATKKQFMRGQISIKIGGVKGEPETVLVDGLVFPSGLAAHKMYAYGTFMKSWNVTYVWEGLTASPRPFRTRKNAIEYIRRVENLINWLQPCADCYKAINEANLRPVFNDIYNEIELGVAA